MSVFRLLFDRSTVVKPRTGPGTPRAISRDAIEITLDNKQPVTVMRVRDPRARRLRLSVDERGARLTLPPRVSDGAGARFVIEHGEWLLAQLANFSDDLGPLVPQVSTCLPLRGAQIPLHWQAGRALRIELADDDVTITLPKSATDAALRRSLREFYEAQIRADVGRWLPEYLPGLPRPPSRVRLRVMSSQWGSLAPDGAMSLDLALILARPDALRYVLVHELCHLIHANHSRAFWREVEARLPGWREQREYFRVEGRRLKAMLHAVCGKTG